MQLQNRTRGVGAESEIITGIGDRTGVGIAAVVSAEGIAAGAQAIGRNNNSGDALGGRLNGRVISSAGKSYHPGCRRAGSSYSNLHAQSGFRTGGSRGRSHIDGRRQPGYRQRCRAASRRGGAVAAVDGGKAMGFRSQLMELIRAEMLRIIC